MKPPQRTLRPHEAPDEAEPRVVQPRWDIAARPWMEYSKQGYTCTRCRAMWDRALGDHVEFEALHSLCEEPR